MFRSAALQDRRRRVLSEERADDADSVPVRRGRRTSSVDRSYPETAHMDSQPRITDLVPTRYRVIALWLLVSVAIIAGLESLYVWMPQLASATTDGHVAAFDLDGEGNLASWFSSLLLLGCTAMSLLIYSIRRHKLDDFNGRYRLWLWAAACWIVMSMDESGSLHEGFKELMTKVTGQRVLGDGSIWWIGPYFLALGAIGVRMLLDMRACRSATAALVATAACYAIAVVTQLGWIMPETGLRGVMVEEGAEMIGTVFLLLSLNLYARHVVFDASGQLAQKAKTAAKETKKTATATASTTATSAAKRDDLTAAPATRPTSAASTATSARPRSLAEEYEELYEEDDHRDRGKKNRQLRVDSDESIGERRKLSKADRKAMRREKERYRRGDDE